MIQNDHTYGLGAMEGLDGEVIIMNNQILINTAKNGKKPTSQSQVKDKDKALLLVTAQVKNWQKVRLDESVSMGTIVTNSMVTPTSLGANL